VLILAWGHRARQGKNTAAQAVLESCPLPCNVHLYAFADALKKEVRTACAKFGGQFALIQAWKEAGLMPEWVHFEEPKPRSLLQWWGTDFRRAKDPDYWVKRLRKTLEQHKPDVALITDVRFPNEVDFIHGMGGHVVKVTRTSTPDVDVNEHPSEAMLDGYTGWDYHIKADTVEDCQAKAVELYRRLSA
jgi:hypothetical protein